MMIRLYKNVKKQNREHILTGPRATLRYNINIITIYAGENNGGKSDEKVIIPSTTVVPERTFVNFATLAESVHLAPVVDF